jgi:hypothetical protein
MLSKSEQPGHLGSLAEAIRPDASIPGGHRGMDFGNQGVAQLDPRQRGACAHAGKPKKYLFGWSLLIPLAKLLQHAPDGTPRFVVAAPRASGVRLRMRTRQIESAMRTYGFGHVHACAGCTPQRTVRFFTTPITPA